MMASIKDDLTAFESIKEKTRPRYKKTWVEFKDFIGAGEEFDSRSPTEEELSSYLRHLRQEKGAASSSMWTLYSMINGVFKEKYGFSLKQYPRLTTLLKSDGQGQGSGIFENNHKVVVIYGGVSGTINI